MHYVIIYVYKDILKIGHVLLKKSYLVDTKENRYVHGHDVQRRKKFNKHLKYDISLVRSSTVIYGYS